MEVKDISFRDVVIKIHASGKIAWLSCYEDWNYIEQGQSISLKDGRMTWVLEKLNGNWVIVHVHWSSPNNE